MSMPVPSGIEGRARVGEPAPDFVMKTTADLDTLQSTATLRDYRGRWLVLFFFPAAFTFV